MQIFPETLYWPVKWINAKILSGSFLLVLALSASSQNKQESSTSLPPVETQAPISKGQKPVFKAVSYTHLTLPTNREV